MCLTKEGIRNRFWRGYPHLRRLFGRRAGSVPYGVDLLSLFDDGELRTSIDHGPLDRLLYVVAIARLLASHGDEAQDAIRPADKSSLVGILEVAQLHSELDGRMTAFRHAVDRAFGCDIDAIRTAHFEAENLSRRLLSERPPHDGDTPAI